MGDSMTEKEAKSNKDDCILDLFAVKWMIFLFLLLALDCSALIT